MSSDSVDSNHPTATGFATADDRGVVVFRCSPDSVIDRQAAIENTEALAAAANGRRSPVLVDIRRVRSVDAGARRYHANESGSVVSAVALLVGSPLSRVIGNFFLGLNRPAYPLRLFADEDHAIEWLLDVSR